MTGPVTALDENDAPAAPACHTTMTDDLLALADWLDEAGVTHAALEATGVYWAMPSRYPPTDVSPPD
jgi:hypothetical protein